MNSIFYKEIDDHVVIFIDDVLVYSKTEDEHIQHVTDVLRKFKENHLHIRMEKCEFGITTTRFLGWVIQVGEIKADPWRVQAVTDWPLSMTTTQLRGFIGLTNQLLPVIPHLAEHTAPLTSLLQGKPKKTDPIIWTLETTAAFEKAKTLCASPVTLKMFDPQKQHIYTQTGQTFPSADGLANLVQIYQAITKSPKRILSPSPFTHGNPMERNCIMTPTTTSFYLSLSISMFSGHTL